MADIEFKARAFWTDTADGTLAAGFAATEDPEDGYVLFEGPSGAPLAKVYTEVSDEIFGAEGAIETLTITETGFHLTLTAKMAAKFGMVRDVLVKVDADDTDGQAALGVLRQLVPAA